MAAADPVKSVTSSYDGFTTSITDAQGRTKTQTLSAVGQVIGVIDAMGTTMSLTYDSVGNRTRVTNAVGTAKQNHVDCAHDRLGRMLTQDDPSHGLYTYTYDALGQKLTEQSPEMASALPTPQIVEFEYDLLGRMISRDQFEDITTWTYTDALSGKLGIGQLHVESNGDFTRTYTYGPGNYGRPPGPKRRLMPSIFLPT